MRWRVFPATWDGQQREGDVAQIVDEDVNGVRVVKAFGQEQPRARAGRRRRPRRSTARRCGRCACSPATSRCCRPIPTLGQVADPGPRRLAGPAPPDHARARSWPSPPTSTQLVAPGPPAGRRPDHRPAGPGRRRADLPAARPAPGHRRRARTRSSCRELRGEIDLRRRRTSPTATGAAGPARLRPAHRGRASGWPSSARAAAASRPRPCWSRASTTPTAGAVLGRRPRRARRHPALAAPPDRRRVRGELPVLRLGPRQHRLRPPGRHRRRDRGGGPGRAGPRVHRRRCPAATTPWSASAGLTLSGGQRQRIALARAHPVRPAHPDPRRRHQRRRRPTEEAIHDALREVMAGRTTLLVAHRRSTLHLADRIVVLDARPGRRAGHPRRARWSAAPLYRRCCPGSTRSVAEAVGDRIEALATLAARRRRPRRRGPGRGSPAAAAASGPRRAGPLGAARASAPGSAAAAAAAGGSTWRRRPSCWPGWPRCRRSATCPTVDLDAESRPDPRLQPAAGCCASSAGRCCSAWSWSSSTRWPRLAGPVLVKTGIDSGVSAGLAGRAVRRRRRSSWSSPWPTWSTRSARPSSPAGPPSGSCCRCGSGSGPSCSASRSTTTSARWPAGS